MNIGLLFIETFILFILTFVYCTFRLSSVVSREEYEKEDN